MAGPSPAQSATPGCASRERLPLDQIEAVDALTGLRSLPNASVDCVVTSPPYWGTRDYGTEPVRWPDGDLASLGLESNPQRYVDHLVAVCTETHRVLKDTGTLWINLGDAYFSCERERAVRARGSKSGTADGGSTVPEKSLCLVPERFALAMVSRGWILRNRIVWYKPNHMPTSAADRLACGWEHLFFFTKSGRYHFDLDAIRIPHRTHETVRKDPRPSSRPFNTVSIIGARLGPPHGDPHARHPLGRNPGDCWPIPTRSSRNGHPAAFPESLCERPILAGCPEGGAVLDPFVGTGTVAVVARRLGRRFIGFDLQPQYVRVARERVAAVEHESVMARRRAA
jgi:DNA modification methylase